MKSRFILAAALQFFAAYPARAEDLDGGVPKSGFIAVEGALLALPNGTLMSVDGGAWADDATLQDAARIRRALKEEVKLAQERQQTDIAKWVGLGAATGALVTVAIGVLVWTTSAPGTK